LNLTNVRFPIESRILLSFGSKFSVPTDNSNLPVLNLLNEIESIIQCNVSEDKRNLARQKTIECFNDLMNHDMKFDKTEEFLIKAQKITKDLIKRNEDVYIVNSDKGNKTVAIYKTDYETKVEELLNDNNTYEIISTDPTKRLLKRRSEIIDNLVMKKYITTSESQLLCNSFPVPPRIYILLKLHKDGIPGRPVVSSIDSLSQPIAKYLCNILNNIIDKSKYHIRSSFDFKSYIDNVKLTDENTKLVSFDVSSLFTNVPIDLVFQIVDEKWSEIKKYTKIPKYAFLDLLKFCIIDSNFFMYKDQFFKQKYGLAMGSSLSPVLSDLVLERLFDVQIPKLPFHLPFMKKYVDDTITMIKEDNIQITLDIFNNFHPRLKFTFEVENDRELPFLDMKLIRNEDSISTNYYRKATSSDRILNFLSAHPYQMKYNTALSFAKRVKSLSSPKFFNSNIDIIKNKLRRNNYPNKLIQTVIKKYKFYKPYNDIQNSETNKSKGNNDKKYSGITFIPKFTERLTKNLNKVEDKINFGFKPFNTNSKLFSKTKTILDKDQNHGVVYQINCLGNTNENCGGLYIGETSRKLAVRVQEHRRDFINKDKKDSGQTALIVHCKMKNHSFDFDNVKILHNENNFYKRRFLESSSIQLNKPFAVNYKQDTNHLNVLYCNIINKQKVLSKKYSGAK
jgi:predicted GIY-YIG superfamily endonuclease